MDVEQEGFWCAVMPVSRIQEQGRIVGPKSTMATLVSALEERLSSEVDSYGGAIVRYAYDDGEVGP